MKPKLKALWQEAFGDSDEAIDTFFATAYDASRQEVILCQGEVGAALYWLDCSLNGEKIAYLYAVATGKAFRGRGLCRQLMEKTHETLKNQGYAGAVLVPQDEGLRTMYGKMGYRDFGGMEALSAAAGAPCDVREITVREYEALRRQYLPEGGVAQEGVTLDYLGKYALFYTGKGWLLAAGEENGAFRGMELLGNKEAAPAILAALGYQNGTFRTPGVGPFAMYRPLTENAQPPAYFGLALD